ncbi:RidA family protein [Agromyces bauzanensis]
MQYIDPPTVPTPPMPHQYPHGIRVGDLLFISGQVAIDDHARVVGLGDPVRQAEVAWGYIREIVEAAGGAVTDVVKISVFLEDIRHAEAELFVRTTLFESGRFPTCTMVQVANLGLEGLLMEIEAVAFMGDS